MEIPTSWTFNSSEVASNFDAHVQEQLPWYTVVTGAVRHIARHYVPDGGLIYDIGASTGNIGRALEPMILDRQAKLIAIDSAPAMREQYKAVGTLHIADAVTFNYERFDLAVCFLTLMFVPPSHQAAFIEKLRERCRYGGAIVVVDKCAPHHGYVATVLYRMALDAKLHNGANPDEIIRKELSLSGIQRPIDKRVLGHDAVEFFRFGDFAGWIIEK